METRDVKGKRIAVIGAYGSVGQAITAELLSREAEVFAIVKDAAQRTKLAMKFRNLLVHRWDVLDQMHGQRIREEIEGTEPDETTKLNAVVYAVGHCPPGGLYDQISIPLSEINMETFGDDLDRLAFGVANIAQIFLPLMATGSRFIVIGSAITRFDPASLPPNFYAGQYALAQAAQAELLRWLAVDPAFVAKTINVTRLMFGAMDTPFHTERNGPKAPHLVPLSEVVESIMTAILAPNPLKTMIVT